MQSPLLAAAGLAEAAWAIAILLMWGALIVIGIVAIIGLTVRPPIAAVAALILFGLFTEYFEPWLCFAPFPAKAHDDPDVAGAAEGFRRVGLGWVFTGLFVIICLIVSLFRRPRARLDLHEIGTQPVYGLPSREAWRKRRDPEVPD